jgi:hypothetical protein
VSRARRLVVGLAALAMPLCGVAAATPAAATPILDGAVSPASSGTDRMCVGLDDVDGHNTTWACLPEAQWYGAVLNVVLALNPA